MQPTIIVSTLVSNIFKGPLKSKFRVKSNTLIKSIIFYYRTDYRCTFVMPLTVILLISRDLNMYISWEHAGC